MLKARYYSICRHLVLNRPGPETATPEEKEKFDKSRQETLASLQFDIGPWLSLSLALFRRASHLLLNNSS
jgi:hypothetical protein